MYVNIYIYVYIYNIVNHISSKAFGVAVPNKRPWPRGWYQVSPPSQTLWKCMVWYLNGLTSWGLSIAWYLQFSSIDRWIFHDFPLGKKNRHGWNPQKMDCSEWQILLELIIYNGYPHDLGNPSGNFTPVNRWILRQRYWVLIMAWSWFHEFPWDVVPSGVIQSGYPWTNWWFFPASLVWLVWWPDDKMI